MLNIFNTVSYALFMYISSFLCGMAKIRIKTRKDMCKSEIFAKIINIVSKETEVSVDQILSSDKKMETVDARYLLVSLRIYFIRMLTRLSNTARWSAFPLPSRNILWHPLWDSCPKWKWLWMLLSASTGRTQHSKIFLPAWI